MDHVMDGKPSEANEILGDGSSTFAKVSGNHREGNMKGRRQLSIPVVLVVASN
jgi:hypothetical protein